MKGKAIFLVAAVALLLNAGPGLADYSIPIRTAAEGGGRASAPPYNLTYTVGQTSPVGGSSNADYSLFSGLALMLVDTHPPRIVHLAQWTVPARVSLELEANVSDDRTGTAAVTVFYHEGGISTFRQKQMQEGDDGVFTATISPSAITEKGLVYYLEATDNASNTSRYPAEAPDSLVCPRVSFADLESPFEMPPGQYRMISLPGSSNGDPGSLLIDDLGQYDRTSWRLGRWNASAGCTAQCYDEYPDLEDFAPGRAFWLISKQAKAFDFTGSSIDITRPYRVWLARGWNQIGTPFAFTTDWLSTTISFNGQTCALDEEHIVGTDTIYVEDDLIYYDGAYQSHRSELEPWKGYWIYNGSTQEVELLLQPQITTSPVASALYRNQPPDVLLAVGVSSGGSRKATILAGLSPQACDGWDPLDDREPPPIGDYVRAAFPRPDWGRYSGPYMRDIRRSNQDGAYWEFRVEGSKAQAARLDVTALAGVPPEWEILVYDLDAGLRLEAGRLPYAFRLDTARRFALAAGDRDFIMAQEAASGIKLETQIVAARPNPFAHRVLISFFIPRPERVRLDVFSVEGRLLGTLADQDLGAGLHTIDWDGRSHAGAASAPGIYFLRLEAGGTIETRKLLRIR
jgi:hypothetical protein